MPELLRDLDSYIDRFADFIGAAPSSYHAASLVAETLAEVGFERHDESSPWKPLVSKSRGFVVRDGAIIAWRAGAEVHGGSPVRLFGCHTDSPGLVVKPSPDSQAFGWAQLGVEIYGGPLLSTWLDRDLALAGRIVTISGEEHLVHTEAMARVPMLAIHLDRELNSALTLDRQRHMQPVIGTGEVSALGILASTAGLSESEVGGIDVRLVDSQPAARIGAQRELFAAPRLDNLSSVFAGLIAMLETEAAPGTISILAAFDHEELGSNSRSGASGPMLEEVLRRLREGLGANEDQSALAMSASWCLSADAGHAVHPNYPEKHDPNVQPVAGGGPMLKVNANQRYSTDAHGAALWARCRVAAGVPAQTFVGNNGVPCGSTIGPLTATRIGIRTLDAGVPLLSMHSARELAHVSDLHSLARIAGSFYAGA